MSSEKAPRLGQGPQSNQQAESSSQLQKIRKAKGLSLVTLAKKAGVMKMTIVAIEKGRRTPKPETIEKIASALGVTVEDLE